MFIKGYKMSQSHKDKIAKAMKGRRVSSGFTGFRHSEKSKDLIRQKKQGVKFSKEHCQKISKANKGKPNFWKSTMGKYKTSSGYILIYSPNHPLKDSKKYVLEHRLVMEKHLGRFLDPKEEVHHINGILDDNRIENLKLFENKSSHIRYHRLNEK